VLDSSVVDWEPLIAAAREARERAYAPYSRYRVGAAVLTRDGAIHAAANVENGLPALGVCAERLAVTQAVAAGHREPVAVAVVTETSPPARPCGLCRQTLAEFADDVAILCTNTAGERVETSLAELLPAPFRLADARRDPAGG
jgi:cytidine deaminase